VLQTWRLQVAYNSCKQKSYRLNRPEEVVLQSEVTSNFVHSQGKRASLCLISVVNFAFKPSFTADSSSFFVRWISPARLHKKLHPLEIGALTVYCRSSASHSSCHPVCLQQKYNNSSFSFRKFSVVSSHICRIYWMWQCDSFYFWFVVVMKHLINYLWRKMFPIDSNPTFSLDFAASPHKRRVVALAFASNCLMPHTKLFFVFFALIYF